MRILVTRPEADTRRTAERLGALGHACLAVPLTEVRMLPFDWPDGSLDAIVVTSANAVPALAAAAAQIPVFAVGARTAAAARAHGCTDVRSGGGEATALLATIACAVAPPARLLYLAGVDRKPVLEAGLAERGYATLLREAYATMAVERLPARLAEALCQAEIDIALHYSRRSAAIFCRLAAEAGVAAALTRMRHHCLSADAAEPLRSLGARQLAVAASPTEAALLATCR